MENQVGLTRCCENLADEKSLDRVTTGDEKMAHTPPGDRHGAILDPSIIEGDYEGKPTNEELKTLRRIPGNLPIVAYMICIVEFCERASYYGVQPLIGNYVNRPCMCFSSRVVEPRFHLEIPGYFFSLAFFRSWANE